MSRPGINPAFSQVPHPVADLGALQNVCEQLKQNVDSIGGFRGDQLGRAVTFQDLIDMGVIDRLVATSPDGSATPPDGAQFFPADPVGSASATGVMMGLKAEFTPRRTGALFIAVSGVVTNTGANQSTLHTRMGVGAAPNNGNALTGVVATDKSTDTTVANKLSDYSTQVIVPDLTIGTTYWIDLSLAASAGTSSVKKLSVSIVEL